jgi:hypothetical protein
MSQISLEIPLGIRCIFPRKNGFGRPGFRVTAQLKMEDDPKHWPRVAGDITSKLLQDCILNGPGTEPDAIGSNVT